MNVQFHECLCPGGELVILTLDLLQLLEKAIPMALEYGYGFKSTHGNVGSLYME